MRPF
jgi:carboxylesterase type B